MTEHKATQATIAGDEESHMRRAIELAELRRGRTSPNPTVGCVIVRDGEVVGEAFHPAAGQPHAEVLALRKAGARARGATAYVSLEPCSTYGRTPPCAEALIEAGVKRVVVAALDPNPNECGAGLTRLEEAGIEVSSGVLGDVTARQNEAYFKWIATGMPFVTAKWAMSLDGKIAATRDGRIYLTGPEANAVVHELRAASDAIVVGVGTVLSDDPALTVRLAEGTSDAAGRPPLRVVVDGNGRTPLDAAVVRTSREVPTLLATTRMADEENLARLRKAGVEVAAIEGENGLVDVVALMRDLGRREVCSVLLEGGARLNWSALAAAVVDKVVAFVSPKVLASARGVAVIEPPAIAKPSADMKIAGSVVLRDVETKQVGDDVMISGYVSDGGDE